jgi:alkylation response protein AidB-like acyl-CoA dehydrogenase
VRVTIQHSEGGDYLARARKLAPDVAAFAVETERDCRVPDALMDKLHDAGMFRLLLPRSLGGAELDPLTFVQITEEIGKADASTAWCICQGCGCTMIAAYLSSESAWEMFGKDPRSILAWGPGPGARAVAVDGGYRVTASCSFASGGRHATWLGAHTPIYESDGTPRRRADGRPELRTMLFPAKSATMIDVWDVIGLRGTGSDSFTVTDLFVPSEHAAARDVQAERKHPGLLYCFPQGSLYASGFAGVALGIARSMMDGFVGLAGEKTPRGFKHVLRESVVAQSEVARAEAKLRSGRALLMQTLDDVWQAVGKSGSLALDQRVAIRLAATTAIHQAQEAVDAIYHAAGSTAVFATSAFERRFRDMHAVTQQMQGRDSHFETVGKFLLGLELDPDASFL